MEMRKQALKGRQTLQKKVEVVLPLPGLLLLLLFNPEQLAVKLP
jgi:hypothetical protein